jgi:hypothetical protein
MKISAILLFLLFPVCLMAQSKKELKDAGIISRTEKTTKVEKRTTVNYTESVEKYDNNGNKIELIEYKSDGDIKTYNQFEYNEKGKLVKEFRIDAISKKPKETIEYQYNEEDKLVKELYYNKKNELTKTNEYTYVNKLKTEKKTTNANGKIVETKTYTYEYQKQ